MLTGARGDRTNSITDAHTRATTPNSRSSWYSVLMRLHSCTNAFAASSASNTGAVAWVLAAASDPLPSDGAAALAPAASAPPLLSVTREPKQSCRINSARPSHADTLVPPNADTTALLGAPASVVVAAANRCPSPPSSPLTADPLSADDALSPAAVADAVAVAAAALLAPVALLVLALAEHAVASSSSALRAQR